LAQKPTPHNPTSKRNKPQTKKPNQNTTQEVVAYKPPTTTQRKKIKPHFDLQLKWEAVSANNVDFTVKRYLLLTTSTTKQQLAADTERKNKRLPQFWMFLLKGSHNNFQCKT
jgi:hypothetical protein